jgi:hypothetical protein
MTDQHPITNKSKEEIVEIALAVTVAAMLTITAPIWVILETGSTAYCRIYECPISRPQENN